MLGSLLESYRSSFRGLPREVWLLSLVSFVNRTGTMVLPFLALYLTREMGFEPSEAGLFLSIYGVGALGGIALGGWLTDRIGYQSVQVASLVLGGLTMFLLGALESRVAIAVVVCLLGLFVEAFRPANSSAVAAFSADHLRARAYGLQRLALNLGWTVGPALGGFLALVDYRLLFWVDGTTCLAAAVLLAWALPARRSAEEVETARAQAPSPWRDGVFVLVLGLLLLQVLVFFQLLSTFPLFLRNDRGFTEDLVGLTIATNTVVIVFCEMQLIRAVGRMHPLKVMGVAGFLTGLGFGLLPWATTVLAIVATVVVWTFGEMLSFPISSAWTANRATPANRGRYMGAMGMCFSVGTILAPALGTAVYEHLGPGVLWGRLHRSRRPRPRRLPGARCVPEASRRAAVGVCADRPSAVLQRSLAIQLDDLAALQGDPVELERARELAAGELAVGMEAHLREQARLARDPLDLHVLFEEDVPEAAVGVKAGHDLPTAIARDAVKHRVAAQPDVVERAVRLEEQPGARGEPMPYHVGVVRELAGFDAPVRVEGDPAAARIALDLRRLDQLRALERAVGVVFEGARAVGQVLIALWGEGAAGRENQEEQRGAVREAPHGQRA